MKTASLKLMFTPVVIIIALINAQLLNAQENVSISIDPSKVEGKIDEKIYGHFLEHIYHSVNGGL